MRFACNGSYSLYAVDTKLYGSVNTAFENMLGNYAKCVESGDAQGLVYAWNLTEPWVSNDAALREHMEDENQHRTYTEKLAEID